MTTDSDGFTRPDAPMRFRRSDLKDVEYFTKWAPEILAAMKRGDIIDDTSGTGPLDKMGNKNGLGVKP